MGKEQEFCFECDKPIPEYRDSDHCSKKCEKQAEKRQEAKQKQENDNDRTI